MLGSRRRVVGERRDQLVDGLAPSSVGMVDAGRGRRVDQPRVELTEVAVVDQRPVVLAGADHADEAVGGVLQRGRRRCRANRRRRRRAARRWRARRARRGVQHALSRARGARTRSRAGSAAPSRPPAPEPGPAPRCRRCRSRKRPSFAGSDVSPSTAAASTSRALGAALRRRVHRAVGRGRGVAPRRRLHQVAEHRLRAARLHPRRPFAVAHERVDVVPAAHERLEHRRSHVSRAACQRTHAWFGTAPAYKVGFPS